MKVVALQASHTISDGHLARHASADPKQSTNVCVSFMMIDALLKIQTKMPTHDFS